MVHYSLVIFGFAILVMLLCITSCSSKITQPQYITLHSHDTIFQDRTIYDSVYIDRDRAMFTHGDTVTIRDIVYKYKYKLLHDTTRITRTDTIPIIREVEKTVPRPLAWYDYTAYLSLLLIIVFCLFKVYLRLNS